MSAELLAKRFPWSQSVAGSVWLLSLLWRIMFIALVIYSNIIVWGIYPRLF